MISMKWLRKNKKKLLAVIGTFVMVAFLLPSGLSRFGNDRQQRDITVGYITALDGTKQPITTITLAQSRRELQALQALQIDRLSMAEFSNEPQNRFPELAIYQLLFSDTGTGQYFRSMLYQFAQQSGLNDTAEQMTQAADQIDRICGLDRSQSPVYFKLLADEAQNAGFAATPGLIDTVFKNRAQMAQGYNLPSLPSVMQEFSLTEEDVRRAVGKYLSIILYSRSITSAGAASEQQLKTAIRNQVEAEEITGKYISLYANNFRTKVAEPTIEQLQAHFNAYKEFEAEVPNDKNPHRFGYKLPERVQIEYLRGSVDDAEKIITEQFQQLPASQREQKVQQFWTQNKPLFRVELPPEKNQTQDAQQQPAEPKFRDPGFDEVAEKAQKMYLRQQARDKVEQLMAQVMRMVATPAGDSAAVADYQAIPEKIKVAGEPSITYKKTDFLSGEDLSTDQELGRTYLVRNKRAEQSLVGMLMTSEPLRKKAIDRLDQTPIRINEDLGPLQTLGQSLNDAQAFYVVRIVAVDKARVPVSIYDDGKKPCDPAAVPDNKDENSLYQKVKNDWTSLQAYQLAAAQAETFAKAAAADWDGAIKALNEQLGAKDTKDPNQPVKSGPVFESDLKQTRDQIGQLTKFMQQQQQNSSRNIMEMIARQQKFIVKTVQLRHQHLKNPESPLIINQPENLRCMVFKELDAPAANDQQYLQRKAMTAWELQAQNQQLLTLSFFDPESIAKRNGYEAAPTPKVTDEEKNLAPAAAPAPAPADDGV